MDKSIYLKHPDFNAFSITEKFSSVLQCIKSVGFDRVGLFGGMDLVKAKEICVSLGLGVDYVHHSGFNVIDFWKGDKQALRELNDEIFKCQDADIKNIVVHLTESYQDLVMTSKGISNLKQTLDLVDNLNMFLVVENSVQDKPFVEIIENYKDYCPNRLKVCFDSGHINLAKSKDWILDRCDLFKGLIDCIHLHDNHILDVDEHGLPFNGTTDWRRIIKFLIDCRYSGSLNLEVYCPEYGEDLFEFIEKSYESICKFEKLYLELALTSENY